VSNDRRSVRAGAGSWGVPRFLSTEIEFVRTERDLLEIT